MQIKCSNPQIIVNPNLPELLCKYHTFCLGGHMFYYKYHLRGLIRIDLKSIYSFKHHVTLDTLSESFVLDEASGLMFPVYIAVPCGHCEICKQTKVNSFVSRCRLETSNYKVRPWFITLTYDNEHIPADGVSVSEIQKFMKRLRINLDRIGYRERLRFVACGEYGKTYHRPHYHLIIWNLCPTKFVDFQSIDAILNQSWQYKGFIQHRIVDPTNDKAFYYTTKYMYKDCIVPEGKNSNFLTYSRGHGSIGAPTIDRLAVNLRKYLNTHPQYFDVWRSKSVPLPLSSYLLNRVFPSLARSVGSDVRTAVKEFAYCYSVFKEKEPYLSQLFDETYGKLNSFSDVIYFGHFSGCECPVYSSSDANLYFTLQRHQRTIERALAKKPDYAKAKEIDRLRSVFLGKLSYNPTVYDISFLEHRARNQRLRSHATEVL